MARFNDVFMDSLLVKNDIVSVVSTYVSLSNKGRKLWGLCPFHNEKTPSFCVNEDKQFFYCFGCGVGGGVIQFIMQIERLSFVEAVEHLARRAGMQMPDNINDEDLRKERIRKERLYEACKLAAKFFNTKLLSDEGIKAREYLVARGIGASVVQRFGLGYAPDGWTSLVGHLTGSGYSEHDLVEAGLANQKLGRVYDAYRNRVVFPIIGVDSRVLGFGARTMGDDLPKYINTSETPIYNKRRSLYALNSVKNEKSADIIIVEGYMDVISLYCAGITNAVASLGTSLTQQQARLLKRYASEVYIAYDGDAAGQKATLRGLDILQSEGLKVKVIVMPEGKDPDDFVRQAGKQEFMSLKSKAVSLNEFKLEQMAAGYDLMSDDGRQDYAIEACKLIATLKPVERQRYYVYVNRRTGISEQALKEQSESEKTQPAGTNFSTSARLNARRSGGMGHRQSLEQSLLKVIVQHPEQMRLLAEKGDELFNFEPYGEFFKLVRQEYEQKQKLDIAILMSELDEEHSGMIAQMLDNQEQIINPERYISDCLERIYVADKMSEIQSLQLEVEDEAVPLEKKLELMAKITDMKKNLRQV